MRNIIDFVLLTGCKYTKKKHRIPTLIDDTNAVMPEEKEKHLLEIILLPSPVSRSLRPYCCLIPLRRMMIDLWASGSSN